MNLEAQVPSVPPPIADAPKKGHGRPRKMTHGSRLAPYLRCRCGVCAMCLDNAKWDRIFAKFAAQECRDIRGVFQSPLRDLF